MVLENIYIVRHAFRMNFSIDHRTGAYSTTSPLPTGIPSDPVLTAHGLAQADQLGAHLAAIQPPIDAIYCSPYYRCIQTLLPTLRRLPLHVTTHSPLASPPSPATLPLPDRLRVRIEPGLGDFHGRAPFAHPKPATTAELENEHFPGLLDMQYKAVLEPDVYGDTLEGLHERVAYVLGKIVEECDRTGVKTVLICSHAACIIVAGRVLTGVMPEDFAEDDFQCYTAGLSVYRRKGVATRFEEVGEKTMEGVPKVKWKGTGVGGGWDCIKNSDCSFLSGGEERGWKFYGDESFMMDPNGVNDAVLESKDSSKL
ncbi:phosphoglycerate mutase-like protein [Microthyrium microscopicum]|uniref:Phosphoglycerate mutase-like protein n=1 Tax=Microthyrium microscopicum TaxID=703497 RepID=A0A6A6UNT0_9PEZI|nr:phosphoglycerate mutase-like protein [Microthyrium microscopicum]